jgi:hypothetical protein
VIVGWEEGGGERGGEAKSAEDWKRVFGREDVESHVKAEGSNIVATIQTDVIVVLCCVVLCGCCGEGLRMRCNAQVDAPAAFGAAQRCEMDNVID